MAPHSGTSASSTNTTEVALWAAKIPVIGYIADHHWFVVSRNKKVSRWEVWQIAGACSTSWGHLHRDLLPPNSGVGNGDASIICQWRGRDADRIADKIAEAPACYPWCNKYRYWPGPNSNTFVQWILRGDYSLGRKALGKHYCRLLKQSPLNE